VDEVQDLLPPQLALPVAQEPRDRRAVVEERPVGAEQADHVRGALDQGAEVLLALAQRVFARLAFE
jgi:hypothetical protein